ncbi:hypothetical protein V5799_017171 [Amblyomma americanum]|uniref:Transmembrane protein n=1 Tax=Amblyomma americanum TaxID=6943 RepID=A0AAQ4F474_AMBAM
MSGDSSQVFLQEMYEQRSSLTRGFSKGTAAAIFAGLSLLGVCGITTVLTVIVRDSGDVSANETATTAHGENRPPASPLQNAAPLPRPAQEDFRVLPVFSETLSADKHRPATQKLQRRTKAGKKASSSRTFTTKKAAPSMQTQILTSSSADAATTLEENVTTELDKHGLVFANDDAYYGEVTDDFSTSEDVKDRTPVEGPYEELWQTVSQGEENSTSSNASVLPSSKASPRETSFTTSRSTAATSTTSPSASSPSTAIATTLAKSMKTVPPSTTTSTTTHQTGRAAAFVASADRKARAHRKPSSSPWLLFCFYDDRSSIRSPGFSVYDFPVQLCTDVAFCCVDVNTRGQVVVTRHLRVFLKVVGQEFLPPNHLFLTLGGHRVLVSHLDAALAKPARFATELSEQVQKLGAGGLAVFLEDVEMLKHAFRVHDLIMAVRGVSVAVVLPRDLRQQVRYYRTEIYANTKDMLVISPPSQGYGRDSRQQFATCPHPRRSVHEGSSLEFIYQLSRTLLSSMAGGADYASGAAAAEDEQPAPRYLIGISFGGLKFHLKNRSHHDVGAPATFVRRVPYREICKQPWHHWHDNVSECFVAWDGNRGWMSSLGPRSVGFTTELVNGLAVFDLDFDDHSGECGNKFPVLRALRAALLAQRPRMST